MEMDLSTMTDQPASFFNRIKLSARPQANPQNIRVFGQARFTVLTDRLIRFEWSANAQFEDRATFAFPTRDGAPVKFGEEREETHLEIKTRYLTLRYENSGVPFDESNLSITLHSDDQTINWSPGMT